MDTFKNIDDYISSFPPAVQKILEQVRSTIKKAAPKAMETISYSMPAFKQNRVLVYFAANKNHVGFYPTPSGIKAFEKDLAEYKFSKGAIQFPIDKPMPLQLIANIVKFRVKEDEEKNSDKKSSKNMNEDFLSTLSAPAQRALKNNGIATLKDLSKQTEKYILQLHGVGPSSIPKLRNALSSQGLQFKDNK